MNAQWRRHIAHHHRWTVARARLDRTQAHQHTCTLAVKQTLRPVAASLEYPAAGKNACCLCGYEIHAGRKPTCTEQATGSQLMASTDIAPACLHVHE